MNIPPVTICVLTYGDHPGLARRVIGSIRRFCPRPRYRLVVGANAVGGETLEFLARSQGEGAIDRLEVSATNINKCPMMRRMFDGVSTEFIWWFDDDSYLTDESALERYLQAARKAPDKVVQWGVPMVLEGIPCGELGSDFATKFVRSAPWYRGLTPPSWDLGGKGELNFQGKAQGDGRWIFITGGCWWIRTSSIKLLDWPDPRLVKEGDDVFLGEALRQLGLDFEGVDAPVAINKAERRGMTGFARTLRLTAPP